MSAASLDAFGTDRGLESASYRAEDFPGCESFHLPASEIDCYDGRLEFWDSVTETAWKVCEPTSIQHEQPSRQLVLMAGQFAMVRGSRIVSFGSADLVRRDAAGRKHWLMQADEVLYLHPDRVRLQGPAIDVDADPLPDVVLEVDHTTDVRRRKLDIYKESGFPEIWVLVPWEASVRAPGLAIHVRRGAGYREEGESRAFPGVAGGGGLPGADRGIRCRRPRGGRWSGRRWRWVRARARTPEHNPLTRSLSARAQAHGDREGHERGLREGHAHERMDLMAAALRARGIEAALDLTEDRDLFRGFSGEALMAAALACTGEADFRRRVREQRGLHAELPPSPDPEG